MLYVKNSTWVTSDSHFGHRGILKFGQRPASHELILLSEWIDRVRPEDTLLHLGDMIVFSSKGSAKRWAKVIRLLPGRKYAIPGNHDESHELMEEAGFELIPPFCQNGVWFTHEPINTVMHERLEDKDWHTNVHGHVHRNEWTDMHDGIPVEGKRYVNVCVEHTKLAPVQYGALGIKHGN